MSLNISSYRCGSLEEAAWKRWSKESKRASKKYTSSCMNIKNNNNNNIYSWVKYLVFDIELVKYLETPPKKEKRFMSNN